jgi:hypothetical protein
MTKMAVRPKIQVDASPDLIEAMKEVSTDKQYRSFREFVLLSIAKAHPELKDEIYRELGLSHLLNT